MTKIDTRLAQLGRSSLAHGGSVNTPIYQTSTILFDSLEAYHAADRGQPVYGSAAGSGDPSYGIAGTPTTFALRDSVMELEKGEVCLLVPSGLSAISTALLTVLKPGDHVLASDSIYGPARRFCLQNLQALGIETTFYDPAVSAEELAPLIRKNTRLLFLESPGSLTFEMQDVDALVGVAKERGITTLFDNSWSTPLFFQPLAHGVDISVIAVTKYLSGHSDVIMGAIVAKKEWAEPLKKIYKNMGLSVSPYDCSLVLRGMRTVSVRMRHQGHSALKIAQELEKHPRVKRVLYPALASDPSHGLWKKYYSGAASMFSVELDKKYPVETLAKCVNSLRLFGIGVSWGGYESLVVDFDPHAIRSATKGRWENAGSMLRLYIGLEDPEDLIGDALQALKTL